MQNPDKPVYVLKNIEAAVEEAPESTEALPNETLEVEQDDRQSDDVKPPDGRTFHEIWSPQDGTKNENDYKIKEDQKAKGKTKKGQQKTAKKKESDDDNENKATKKKTSTESGGNGKKSE